MAWHERRQLIVMPRAMPVSAIHLDHRLRRARTGAVIRPPDPGFYNHVRGFDPREIEQERIPHWGLAANVA
jgi:3-polyprenyl-4-hydroxybenzoate decarboxylase